MADQRQSPRPAGCLRFAFCLMLAVGGSWRGIGENSSASATGSARPPHWAFRSPERPDLPEVPDASGWVRQPLDRFVLAGMQRAGLRPSPEADRTTWLRRVSLDLIGLPPTLAEVSAFLADRADGAWERQVERLLASPHFGERWARLWLDLARYADSNGYEKDRAREMSYYRDWVIGAFNRDLPYDQFLIEQLAGDLLPRATQDQVVATGFLRNSMINEEGAIDPEQFRMDAMFDRMDCLGKSVLGLTIQCGQCHDHKSDPFTQADYYRLFALLNNDDELTRAVYPPAELERIAYIQRRIAELENELRERHPDWRERLADWEQRLPREGDQWSVMSPYEYGDPGGLSKLTLQSDGSMLAGGHRFAGGTWRIKVRTALTNLQAIRLEVLCNANLPEHGPGRSRQGTFALREFRLKSAPLNQPTNTSAVVWKQASADFSAPQTPPGQIVKDQDFSGPIALAMDGNERTAWTIEAGPGRRNTDRKAVFQSATNFGYPGGTELTFELVQHDEIGCFRLSATSFEGATADPVPRAVRAALAVPRAARSPAQAAVVFSYWRTMVPEFAAVNARIDSLWEDYPEFRDTALVLHRRTEPRDTRILRRGDWLKPTTSVAPGVPSFLNPASDSRMPDRLALARWLANPQAPTTARVCVNRIWQAIFGAGLVTTPEDFGVLGERPSHPELLDWLACEFMRPSGPNTAAPWSIKHLLRCVVNSATYRQASRVSPEAREVDPYNRLLARGPRFRVEAEMVRDVALAASGLLNPKVGGPSLYTPAPAFLFEPPTSYSPFPWKEVTGADRYRRALYTFRRRSTPYPMLQTFDAPNGDTACVRRLRSNTPLQALTALNEPLFVDCAQALARRALAEGGLTDPERLQHAFRRVLSRSPNARELGRLTDLLNQQLAYLAEGWVNVQELGTGRNEPPEQLPAGTTPTQLAAYTIVARVLLNLDEALTKE